MEFILLCLMFSPVVCRVAFKSHMVENDISVL